MRIVVATLAAIALIACKKDDTVVVPAEPAPAPAPEETKPIDHLAADELLPGTEDALGVRLPRGFGVTRRYGTEVRAEGSVAMAKAVTYFKSHTREGKLTTRAHSVVIEAARVPEKPGAIVDVQIDNPIAATIVVTVKDASPAPPPVDPDEASRRRTAGLSPDGKRVLDPSHME